MQCWARRSSPRRLPAQDLPPELAVVPGDALGFLHVRVADVWKGEAIKDLRKVIQKAGPEYLTMLDQRFVPAPSSIDRATVVFWMPAKQGAPPPMIAVLTTNKPFDADKLVKRGLPHAQPAMAGNVKYFTDESNDMALRVISDHALLFGSAESVKSFLGKSDIKPGAFEPAVRSAAAGRAVTLAINPSLVPRPLLSEIPSVFMPIFKANLLHVGIEPGKQVKIDLNLRYADENSAKSADAAIQAGIALAKTALEQYRKEAEAKLFAKNKGERSALEDLPEAAAALAALGLVNQVEEILKDFPLKRDGSAFAASVTLPEGPYSTVVSTGAVAAGFALPAVQKVREAAARLKSSNNLKQIGLAFHNYHDVYSGLPAAAICDKNGKPILSWRVAILPFIEQDNLYKQFKLDEPWDSEHNIKLIQRIPPVYVHPKARSTDKYPSTHYQVFVGHNAAFEWKRRLTFAAFSDGLSNTIWLAEAEKAVPWTKPEDINYDGKTMPKLGKFWPGGFQVGFADGSVRFITNRVPASTWNLLIQRNDGMVIPDLDK